MNVNLVVGKTIRRKHKQHAFSSEGWTVNFNVDTPDELDDEGRKELRSQIEALQFEAQLAVISWMYRDGYLAPEEVKLLLKPYMGGKNGRKVKIEGGGEDSSSD